MAETFMINQLMINSKSMLKLETLQQEKEMFVRLSILKNHYQLIAVHLSKQKELDADPRAIQQIEFYGKLKTNSEECIVLEKSKETVLEFYRGTVKVL